MRRRITLLLILSIITASIIGSVQPASVTENYWTQRPPMPKETSVEVGVVNGKIYALMRDGTLEEYDPYALTWTPKEPIPTPRGSPGMVVCQNKIYVIGGTSGINPTTGIPILSAVNEVYNPATNTWETRKPIPTKRSQLVPAVVGGKIYLIGGLNDTDTGTASDFNEVYDPATDTWTTRKPMPTAVFSYASAVVEDKIYFISGTIPGKGNANLTQIYDPATDTWSLGKPPLTSITDAAAGATTGLFAPTRIYVVGGRTAATGLNLNQVYDPETDQWSWGASMMTPRYGLAAAVVNDTLYALGGWSFGPLQGTTYTVNELYIPFGYQGPVPPVRSPPPTSNLITITASGDIEGTDKIRREGEIYTFMDDITGSIVIERNDITIDGAGHTLMVDSEWGIGIDIRERNNVAVRNLTVKGALGRCGILLINTDNCKITQNNIIDNLNGIEMTGTSSRNRITGNLVQNNSVGMEIYSTKPGHDNIISDNEVTDNSFGMQIKDFLNTEVSGNKITSNTYGLGLGLGSGSTARNNTMENNTYGFRAFNIQRERSLSSKVVNVDVDTSNTVDGKPIIYWVDQHSRIVPSGACYVALIGCTGTTIENLDLGGNLEGVFLGSTTNSTIIGTRISKCLMGVNLDASSNNMITRNRITENENGIHMRWGSLNNTIEGNDITGNTGRGIYLADSADNKITGNNIANCETGIYTEYCGTNIIHHNNFVNNTKQWDDIGFTPWPIPLQISTSVWDDGKEGNYWSDYNGADANGDGVGDTPYVLGANNTDRYPLMKPIAIPGLPNGLGEAEPFPTSLLVVTITALAVVLAGLLLYLRKRHQEASLA